MKKKINGVLIVEGSNDASYISSLYEGIIVITNGYEIPKDELDFLINLPKDKTIYILTDSDEAGKTIRDRLNKLLSNTIDLSVDIARCNKNGKHGVAECEKDELMKVLDTIVEEQKDVNYLTTYDLINLGIDNKDKRDYLSEELHLGKCNNKTLLKRINYLNIEHARIREIMERYGN